MKNGEEYILESGKGKITIMDNSTGVE